MSSKRTPPSRDEILRMSDEDYDRLLVQEIVGNLNRASAPRFVVMVNSRHTDESERYRDSEHATPEAAIARCQALVREWIEREAARNPGITGSELLDRYRGFGPDPFVVGEPPVRFSARDYAAGVCARR